FDLAISDDFRMLTVALKCGDRVVSKSVPLRTVQYRDIYQDGETYMRGDLVTFGGSLWIAVKDNPEGKPRDGKSADWRLAAKHGRDGRDGRNGIDFTAPVKVP